MQNVLMKECYFNLNSGAEYDGRFLFDHEKFALIRHENITVGHLLGNTLH